MLTTVVDLSDHESGDDGNHDPWADFTAFIPDATNLMDSEGTLEGVDGMMRLWPGQSDLCVTGLLDLKLQLQFLRMWSLMQSQIIQHKILCSYISNT